MTLIVVVMIPAGPILRRLEPGALRHRQLRHPDRTRQAVQGRAEPIAIDQHQPGLSDLAALFRAELQLMGIVAGAEQTRHPQCVGRQPTGDVAERPIGGDHISARRGTTANDNQQQHRQPGRHNDAHTQIQKIHE